MSQALPPDLERFVEQELANGQYASREELLADAVRLLRERQLRLDELRIEIEQGREEILRGEAIVIKGERELRDFFDDVKRRGRERYEAAHKQ